MFCRGWDAIKRDVGDLDNIIGKKFKLKSEKVIFAGVFFLCGLVASRKRARCDEGDETAIRRRF